MKYCLCRKKEDTSKYENKQIVLNKNKSKSIRVYVCGLLVIFSLTLIGIREIDYKITSGRVNRIYEEEIDSMDKIIGNISDLAKDLNIDNPMKLCGFIYKLLNNGHLSYLNEYAYDNINKGENLYDISGHNELDIVLGSGVCRSESNLVKRVLNECGYEAYSLNNQLSYDDKNFNHEFTLIFYNDNSFVYDLTNNCFYTFKDKSASTLKPQRIDYENVFNIDMRIIMNYIGQKISLYDTYKIYNKLTSNMKTISDDEIMDEYYEGIDLYYSVEDYIMNDFATSIKPYKDSIATNLQNKKRK